MYMKRYKTRKYRKRRERRKRRRTVKGGVSRVAPSGQGQGHTPSNSVATSGQGNYRTSSVAPEVVKTGNSRKRTFRQTVKHLVSLQLPKNALAKIRLHILNHKVFRNLNLSNIDLKEYNLDNKTFTKCILRGCNLINAVLTNTIFESCDLTGADLTGVVVNSNTSLSS